jgi:hypothetical protein
MVSVGKEKCAAEFYLPVLRTASCKICKMSLHVDCTRINFFPAVAHIDPTCIPMIYNASLLGT